MARRFRLVEGMLRSVVPIALAVVVAGCGALPTSEPSAAPTTAAAASGSASGAASPAASATPVASASGSAAPASPRPSATPGPTAAPSAGRLAVGRLAAGTFASTGLRPRVILTVPAGFQVRAQAADYVWLSIGAGRRASEIAIMRVAHAGIIDGMVGRTGLQVGDPVSLTVGGLPARAIDLSLAGNATADSRIVNTATSTYFVFPPGTSGRLIELAVRGSPVVILYDAQSTALASFSKIAQRVVASLQFPP